MRNEVNAVMRLCFRQRHFEPVCQLPAPLLISGKEDVMHLGMQNVLAYRTTYTHNIHPNECVCVTIVELSDCTLSLVGPKPA